MTALLLVSLYAAFAGTAADTLRADALALARDGRWEQARAILLRARAEYPADKRFAIDLAGVAYRMGDRPAAKSHIRSALRIDAADPYANNFAATLYLLDGNLDAAVKYWNRVGKPALRAIHIPNDPGVDPGLLRKALPRAEVAAFLTSSDLRGARVDLDALDVFSTYRLELQPAADERFDLHFDASSGELHTGPLGRVLPYLRGLPYQTLHIDFRNLRGSAVHFASLWRWDPDKRRGLISLSGPVAGDPRWRLGMTLDMRDENWDTGTDFSMRRDELAGELSRRLTDRFTLGLSAHLTERRFTAAGGEAPFADAWSLKQAARLEYLAADYPEHAFTVRVGGSGELGRVFGHATFARTQGEAAARWNPRPWLVEARALAGKTSGTAPFDEVFVLGMERDTDLWLRGHAATRDGRKGASPLARDYFLVQSGAVRELWRRPGINVGIGPFVDTARAWDSTGRFGSRRWLVDAGLELRVGLLSRLTVRLIYGRNLREGGGAFYSAVSR